MRKAWYALGAAMLLVVALASTAAAEPDKQGARGAKYKSYNDNLPGANAQKQNELRQQALVAKLHGKAKGKKYEVSAGQYAQLSREGTDRIFVLLVEFGNRRHASFCDAVDTDEDATNNPCAFPADGSAATYDGPENNKIPAPDRSVDNSTPWKANYDNTHYENMYFNRMKAYYERQSSGRYSISGGVHGWVQVPFNEARYGRDFCGSIVCSNTWFLIRDGLAYWVQGELANGRSMASIQEELRSYDVEDRYDTDFDGNFHEPDGFIDHFQIVHAGGDQAAGDPSQGTDAIWSHRSQVGLETGPGVNPGLEIGRGGASSGLTIPTNLTGMWVGDYTIQPENGGLGVFAHEYAHDLGLPDLYDTSGNTGGAENNTAFWTLMSSGANIGDGGADGIGDAPVDMGAWEKFQLGWLGCETCEGGRTYDAVLSGNPKKTQHQLAPASKQNFVKGKEAQALFVVLPELTKTFNVGPAASGQYYYWSRSGNDLKTWMTKPISYAAGSTLSAKIKYDIEQDWDYAFIEVSSDNGQTWTALEVPGHSSDPANDNSGFNQQGGGITGTSEGWEPMSVALPGSGSKLLRIRYRTDGAVAGLGFSIDDIAITGNPVDGAETGNEGWTYTRFERIDGVFRTLNPSVYIAEYKTHTGYDSSLATAYNFGFLDSKPDWVETHPYAEGLLVNYWNGTYEDNNVGEHPGEGQLLPVDAHPTWFHSSDGHLLRNRVLSFDSAFGLKPVPSITVHKNSQPTTIPAQAGNPLFDDTVSTWSADDGHVAAGGTHVGRYQPGWYSVRTPNTGTQIRVVDQAAGKMIVHVRPGK
jgi:immune inhibitor A